MRLKKGDHLQVLCPDKRWECEISKVLQDAIELQVLRELPSTASKLHLALAQGISKGERFEWLIQKATELGVSEIFPVITERTIVRPTNPDARVQRWNEIAYQAAGQSENSQAPAIYPPETLDQFIHRDFPGLKLLLHEREAARPLREILRDQTWSSITAIVGPEGGWTSGEVKAIENAGFRKVHLGDRILRAETAGLALAAILQYELGDFQ